MQYKEYPLFEQIQKDFPSVELSTLSEVELRNYQLDLVKTQAFIQQQLKETAKPKPQVDDVDVVEYINKILQDGFKLQKTALSSNSKMRDAQKVKVYGGLIKSCVQNSAFSEKTFKVKGLHKQRNNIGNAKTLHELRQAVDDMIPVLEVIRELTAAPEDSNMDFSTMEIDYLIQENDRLTEVVADKERVISEVLGLYNDDSITFPNKVTQTMQLHSCSEVQACKILGIGRTTLHRAKQNSIE